MGEELQGLGEGITPRGKALILIAAIFYGIAVVAPQSSARSLLILGSFLLVLLYISKILFDLELKAAYNLRVERRLEKPLVEGRATRVELSLTNNSLTPLLFVEVMDPYPPLFRLVGPSNKGVVSVPGRGKATLTYKVKPVVGRHILLPVKMIIRDPAGLFAREIEVGERQEIRVQPGFEELKRRKMLIIPTLSPGGALLAGKRGIGTQFLDLREYVPGDEYRRIEWKSSARLRRLMVKEYEQETSLEIMLVLDSSPTMAYGIIGSTKLEYSLRALASIAAYLLSRGDMVGLTIAKTRGARVLKPGRGKSQYARIMHLLSSVEWPHSSTAPPDLAEALVKAAATMRRGRSLYIIFSDLEKSEESVVRISGILEKLRSLRNEVIVIAPYTPLFEVKGLSGVGEALYRIYAARSVEERARISREMLKKGVVLVNVGPEDIVEATLMRVEAVRRMMG